MTQREQRDGRERLRAPVETPTPSVAEQLGVEKDDERSSSRERREGEIDAHTDVTSIE